MCRSFRTQSLIIAAVDDGDDDDEEPPTKKLAVPDGGDKERMSGNVKDEDDVFF